LERVTQSAVLAPDMNLGMGTQQALEERAPRTPAAGEDEDRGELLGSPHTNESSTSAGSSNRCRGHSQEGDDRERTTFRSSPAKAARFLGSSTGIPRGTEKGSPDARRSPQLILNTSRG